MPRHRKQNKRHSRKMYKMKGCSKKRRTMKKYLGGKCGLSQPANMPSNLNGANPLIPSTGPLFKGFDFLTGSYPMKGGNCGGSCPASQIMMRGGNGINPIPDPLVGSPWSANNLPASITASPHNANHFPLNTYNNDVALQMKATGAAPPFSSFKGGRRNKRNKTNKKQRGGIASNFLAQDFLNLGRQVQSGLVGAYDGIKGVHQQASPLPWRGQLSNTSNISTLKKLM